MEEFDDNERGREDVGNVIIDQNNGDELSDGEDGSWESHVKNVRRQIENDDPDLTELGIGPEDYLPRGDGGWARDGESVGRNTCIEELALADDHREQFEKADVEDFFRGLSSNRAIRALRFHRMDLFRGDLFGILVPFFRNNRRFGRLVLRDCSSRTGCIRSLARALEEFDSLKEFVIGNSWSKTASDELQDLIRALGRHSDLDRLELEGHKIEGGVCALVAKLLQNPRSNLAVLNLHCTSIDDENAVILAEGLASNDTLKELYLGDNPITDEGWGAIFDFLRSAICKLEKLFLYNSPINDRSAQSLANALMINTVMKTLDLSANRRIATAGWQAIFRVLQKQSCALEDLNLRHNRLSDNAAVCLANSLMQNRSLRTLDLSYNHGMTVSVWRAFSSVLQSPNAKLQTLKIVGVRITEESVNCVANALANNRSMRVLDLCGNCESTTPASWQTLSTVLRSPQSMLEHLSLSRNGINDEALASLASALVNNTKLRELHLSANNSITATGWEAFSPVLRSPNSALEVLDISYCSITDDIMISLANSLSHNRLLKSLQTCDVAYGRTPTVTANGWGAFSQLLCNETTIMDTYQSNHSLQNLREDEKEEREDDMPSDLRSLLRLNRRNSRSQVARLKIIKTHFHEGFVVQPFVDMEYKVLPRAVSWMGRDGRPDGNINRHFYEFLRSMPLLFDVNSKSRKRKRED